MRGNTLVCLLLLASITVAVWIGCTDDPVRQPTEAVTPMEGDDGAGLYDWAIGPIDGITTVWHQTPKEITVPVGTTLRLKCADPTNADITWSNAAELTSDDGGSIAEVRVERTGSFEIAVESSSSGGGVGGSKGKPGGLTPTILHSCIITGVAVAAKDIRVGTVSLKASPFTLSESSSNEETMRTFFAGGVRFQEISQPQEIAPDRYVSAVGRMLVLDATAEDARFTSLIELRVPGARPRLAGRTDVMLAAPGKTVISVGPTANPRRIVIETYGVTITSPAQGQSVPEDQAVTFRAKTTPPGYEKFITWVSSTKHGSALPVVGHGPTFVATFSNTWGPHDEIPNITYQWLGVRADNATLNQDQKLASDLAIFSVTPAAGPDETIVTVLGQNFGNDPDSLCALLRNPVTGELIGCRVTAAAGTVATVQIGHPRAALDGIGLQFCMAKGPGDVFPIVPPADVTLPPVWVWRRDPALDPPGQQAMAPNPWAPGPGSAGTPCIKEFHSGPPVGGELKITITDDWGIGNVVTIDARVLKNDGRQGDTKVNPTFTAAGTRLQCAVKICNMLQAAYLGTTVWGPPININCTAVMVGPNAVITISCADAIGIADGGVDICVK